MAKPKAPPTQELIQSAEAMVGKPGGSKDKSPQSTRQLVEESEELIKARSGTSSAEAGASGAPIVLVAVMVVALIVGAYLLLS